MRQWQHKFTGQRTPRATYASYTTSMHHPGQLFGCLFCHCCDPDSFGEGMLGHIDPFWHLIAFTFFSGRTTMHTLLASMKTARESSSSFV